MPTVSTENPTNPIPTSLGAELPHLQRYARSLTRNADDADDLVQECCERALAHGRQFRPGTNLRGWLFTILRNAHIDQRRKIARRGHHVPVEDWYYETHQPAPQDHHLQVQHIVRNMDRLRPCDRQVVRMSVFQGLPHDTIAQRLDIAVGTVKSRLSRARQVIAN
ncbi:MAG: RNA polymerase sigma factor [Rhodothalassiaceae bacterium]